MKKTKKLVSALLTLCMLLTMVSTVQMPAYAADATHLVNASIASTRTDELISKLNGKYFTTTGKTCGNSSCDYCNNKYIIKTDWLKSTMGLVPTDVNLLPGHFQYSGSITPEAWSCAGFANYCLWYIYAKNSTDNVRMEKIYAGSFTKSSMDASGVRKGDVVRTTNGHSFIYISHDSNGVLAFDSNYSNTTYPNLVQKHVISWNSNRNMAITRGKNWEGGSTTVHGHSYSGSYYESAHPHKVYKKCSCGKTQYTGATTVYSKCSTCTKVSTKYPTPFYAYTIATGKTTVYNAINGTAKTNKIYDTDLCTISTIYDCGWCKVTFPLNNGGKETGYCKTSVFIKGSKYVKKTSSSINTYSRSNLSKKIGYTGSGDTIYFLGNTDSAIQILYPLTAGGWKVGWVPSSAFKITLKYNANGGTGTVSNQTITYDKTVATRANAYVKKGYTFAGWNAYRNSDKTWYVANQGWFTSSVIKSKNFTKKVYNNSANFHYAINDVNVTSETITMYATWKPNTLKVYYNANGGTISSTNYKLISNKIAPKDSSSAFVQTWTYNSAKSAGLANASSFGLTKKGYKFVGWGTTSTGGVIFDQNDSSLVPSKINKNIEKGNSSITLYAIWKK